MGFSHSLGRQQNSFKDSRIKAAIALSPNVPIWAEKRGVTNLRKLYRNVDIPLFHITGTRDSSPLSKTENFDPTTRTLPYKNIGTSDQYLLILDGAEHSDFGGKYNERTASVKDAVTKGIVLFFDAYLKNDMASKTTLKNDFIKSLTTKDHFEYK